MTVPMRSADSDPRFRTDPAGKGISPDRSDQLIGLCFIILFHIELNGIIQSHLIFPGVIRYLERMIKNAEIITDNSREDEVGST